MSLTQREIVINEAVKKPKTITLSDYLELLKKHDWLSSFSDSFAVQKRGDNEFEWLKYIAANNELFTKLLNDYKHYIQNRENGVSEPKNTPEDNTLETSYDAIIENENGILLKASDEYGRSSEIWDKTTSSDGHFSINEINGGNVGVFPSWEIALSVASYATNSPDGGYGDVLIENVSVYDSFDEWFD